MVCEKVNIGPFLPFTTPLVDGIAFYRTVEWFTLKKKFRTISQPKRLTPSSSVALHTSSISQTHQCHKRAPRNEWAKGWLWLVVSEGSSIAMEWDMGQQSCSRHSGQGAERREVLGLSGFLLSPFGLSQVYNPWDSATHIQRGASLHLCFLELHCAEVCLSF